MIELEKELIQGLKVLDENDRDLRTLTIFCNPNYIRGPDKNIRPKILKILNEMEIQNKVKKTKKRINTDQHHHINLELFHLI